MVTILKLMKTSKYEDGKVYSTDSGRLYVKAEEIMESEKGKQLLEEAKQSSIYKAIRDKKKQ